MTMISTANELAEQGNIQKAKIIFDRLFSSTRDLDALYGLAFCSYREEKFDIALSQLNEILDVDPRNVEAFNLAGIIAAKVGNLEDAKALFIAAIENDQAFLEAQRNYGEVLLETGDFDNGVNVFHVIIKNHPEDVTTLIRMADLYTEVNRDEDALLLLERALEIQPDNMSAISLLNRIQGKTETKG